MIGSDGKYRAVQLVQRLVVNPPVRLAWRLGLAPPGDAQLETTGRHTGRPHRTPICNGLDGATFWLIAQHGHRTDYVRISKPTPASGSASGLAPAGWPGRGTSSRATIPANDDAG